MKPPTPELESLGVFLNEFSKESDRGAALMAASMLDERLQDILAAFFIESKASDDLLSGFNAPLGTFASRASAAFVLGLIQENEFLEITVIRKIRNEFGHDWKPIPYESGPVADLCARLPWLGPKEYEATATNRARFNTGVAMLLVDLMWRTRLVQNERRESKAWPNRSGLR